MNKRGFTLIEILAVIVILALLAVLATSNIFGITDKVKNKISEVREKQFLKGATTLANEIDMCDITGSEITNLFNDETIKKLNGFTSNPTCSELKSKINNGGLMLTADFLKDNKYASGDTDDINYFYTVKNNKGKIEGNIETLGKKDTLGYYIFMKATDSTNTNATKYVFSLGINPVTNTAVASDTTISAVLGKTEDDFGNSYYYRGNVNDNYVSFAGMCFRIVRIEGDGSIKLILQNNGNTCSSTYNPPTNLSNSVSFGIRSDNGDFKYVIKSSDVGITNSIAKKFFDFQSQSDFEKYLKYLNYGNWCFDILANTNTNGTGTSSMLDLDNITLEESRVTVQFDSRVRLFPNTSYATLKCNGKTLNEFSNGKKIYVSTLTADEVVFAGLNNSGGNSYLYHTDKIWTLSPFNYTGGENSGNRYASVIYYSDKISSNDWNGTALARPTIRLKKDVKIKNFDTNNTEGIGTISNPYIIDTD